MKPQAVKLGTRAAVRPTAGMATDELLALARERAPDAAIFDSISPFFWQVRASSNRLDFYDTRMNPKTTLPNFVRGMGEGVSYLDSHNGYRNGWGQSLTGRLVSTDEHDPEIDQKIVEAWGEFFTLPGLTLSGQSTDSFIAAVRSGVWKDVSVGFYASDIECSICGQQSFEWWKEDGCSHIPGHTYTFKKTDIRAFAWINDGELVEVSQVYEGASPSAAVLKAEQMGAEGRLDEDSRAFIERRHGVRIAVPDRVYALGGIALGKESPMEDQDRDITTGTRRAIEAALVRAIELGVTIPDEKAPVGARVALVVDALESANERAASLQTELAEAEAGAVRATDEIARLRPLADDGKRYRDDLINDAIAAGARAMGSDFQEETYRGILDRLDIDGIRTMRDDFTKRGDALFPSERVTRESADDGAPEQIAREHDIDPERYRG